MYRKILVPIDSSAVSIRAAQVACDLVRSLGGQLTLLHVLDGVLEADEARTRLGEVARAARQPPKLLVVDFGGGVVDGVLAAARHTDADLIVIGVSGHAGHAALGGVARELAGRAPVPVHVVPAHARKPGRTASAWQHLVDPI